MPLSGASAACHSPSFCVQARGECRTPRLVVGGVIGIDPRQRLEKRRGDDLGILRVEPVMRVAAAMGVAVARPHAHAAKLEHRDAARGIDVERAAAGNLGASGLREKAISPEVVVEPNPYEQARRFEAQHVLRLRLIALDVDRWRREVDRRDAVAADRFDEALEVARRRDDRDALLGCARQCEEERGEGLSRESAKTARPAPAQRG